MNSGLTEAQKLDILLSLSKEFNLKETDDPATYTMNCGAGYTLFACVNRSWYFQFEDGITAETYDIESSRVPFTNAKDARKLCKKYEDECENACSKVKTAGNADIINTETVNEHAQEVLSDAEKLAMLDEIMDGEIEPPKQSHEKLPVKKEAVVKSSALPAIQKVYNFSEKQLQAIKDTVAKGASDSEFEMLMYLANRYQLDPILKEIFYSPQLKTIMTSRDGYLKIAHRDATFEGIQSMAVCENDEFEFDVPNCSVKHKFGKGDRGKVLGAWAIVYRTGRRPQLSWAATKEQLNNNPAWKYVSAMSCKCAENFALKRAFSISGLVTQEEFGIEDNVIAETVPIIDAEYMEVEA